MSDDRTNGADVFWPKAAAPKATPSGVDPRSMFLGTNYVEGQQPRPSPAAQPQPVQRSDESPTDVDVIFGGDASVYGSVQYDFADDGNRLMDAKALSAAAQREHMTAAGHAFRDAGLAVERVGLYRELVDAELRPPSAEQRAEDLTAARRHFRETWGVTEGAKRLAQAQEWVAARDVLGPIATSPALLKALGERMHEGSAIRMTPRPRTRKGAK
jgi:hypothetical protein